ncbi:MAG: 2-hydroxyacyl-CoA dehydratase family protein [Pseudomonadota bacterium]
MTRKEYLIEQKQKGRKIFGVFPAQVPKEILWAMNVVPMEIWDPPVEVIHANTHLQPYICSVVKGGLELILQGKCDDLDGFLFPHTCDSIQNLASIVYDYLGVNKPCYFFYHPKAPYKDSAREYYMEQLKALTSRLEKQLGPLDPLELIKRIKQGDQISEIINKIYILRREGNLKATNVRFYRIIRRGEALHPDDYIPLLEGFLAESKGRNDKGPRVILSGVLPNPEEILSILDGLGVSIVDDDLLNCGRRLIRPVKNSGDPFQDLTDGYFGMPPCTTRDSPISERVSYLFDKIEHCHAKGVIFNMTKFCEPELFDLPQAVSELRKRGVATLVIETELNQGVSGQLATRIEAFVELLNA